MNYGVFFEAAPLDAFSLRSRRLCKLASVCVWMRVQADSVVVARGSVIVVVNAVWRELIRSCLPTRIIQLNCLSAHNETHVMVIVLEGEGYGDQVPNLPHRGPAGRV